jgi:preprotein translocase subunit SecB
MKAAPIQLLQVMFTKVHVELDKRHAPEDPPNPFTAIFTFDGVTISTAFGIAEIDPDHERGSMFLVTLRVVVANAQAGNSSERAFCPYLIDVEARGVVVVLKGAERFAPPADLAAVNGASLLWSAVREQVLSITSRMAAGPVTLPTMNFHDLKQDATPESAVAPAKKAKAAQRKKPRNADRA